MRISDWSSDVCSSDLAELVAQALFRRVDHHAVVYVEHQLANLGEAPDRARRHAPRVQLVDLAVVVEDDFVKRFGHGWIVRAGLGSGGWGLKSQGLKEIGRAHV